MLKCMPIHVVHSPDALPDSRLTRQLLRGVEDRGSHLSVLWKIIHQGSQVSAMSGLVLIAGDMMVNKTDVIPEYT